MYSAFRPDLHEIATNYIQELMRYMSGGFGTEELEAKRIEQLRDVIAYAKAGSPFYGERLRSFDPRSVEGGLDRLVQCLPYTTKVDLRDAGMALCSDSISNAWVYYETTGTTGPSTPCPRNETDSLVNNAFLTLRYRSIFDSRTHVVGVMGPTELHSTGDTFEDVLRSLGHTVVKMWPRSPVVGISRVQRLILDLKITALVCTPAVAAELLRYVISNGLNPQQLGVEVILAVGELITPSRLRNLAKSWGAKIFNCMYASQETSILAACGNDGELQTIPLNNYYELLSPTTEESLMVGSEDSTGELVITHLYKGSKPLLRYRTGDLVRCKASPHERWVIQPIGRIKDVLFIDGRPVYAFDLENAIFEKLETCFEYIIEINHMAGRDRLQITLEPSVELDDGVLLDGLRRNLEDRFGAATDIEVGDTGKLIGTAAMVSWKAARIHDLRHPAANIERQAALDILKSR